MAVFNCPSGSRLCDTLKEHKKSSEPHSLKKWNKLLSNEHVLSLNFSTLLRHQNLNIESSETLKFLLVNGGGHSRAIQLLIDFFIANKGEAFKSPTGEIEDGPVATFLSCEEISTTQMISLLSDGFQFLELDQVKLILEAAPSLHRLALTAAKQTGSTSSETILSWMIKHNEVALESKVNALLPEKSEVEQKALLKLLKDLPETKQADFLLTYNSLYFRSRNLAPRSIEDIFKSVSILIQ